MKSILSVVVLVAALSSFAHAEGTGDVYPKKLEYKEDNYNVNFSPLSLLLGVLHGRVDFRINHNWTLGPELMYGSFSMTSTAGDVFDSMKISTYSVGGRANWFANGVYTDGLYLGAGLSYLSLSLSAYDSFLSRTLTASTNVPYASGYVGYGWFWESFNMMLGAGLYAGGTMNIAIDDGYGNRYSASSPLGSGFSLEYNIGWTF